MKLSNVEFFDYQKLVREVNKENPNWRIGQTYFNVLYQLYPDLADEIRGSSIDPFHTNNEEKLYDFFKYITKSN